MEYIINELNVNQRIDQLAAKLSGYSRTKITEMIKSGDVKINDKKIKANYKAKLGDMLRVNDYVPKPFFIDPIAMDLNIVYEDDYLLIVNKQRGLVVHPSKSYQDPTLLHGLIAYLNPNPEQPFIRPGLVHRLDKDTSGLLVVAKNDSVHTLLANQIAERVFIRKYIAVVKGTFPDSIHQINRRIGVDPKNHIKMMISDQGKDALTKVRRILVENGLSILECELQTGRTHQIRVHLQSVGFPIVGDPLYGEFKTATGQALCSYYLEFDHPVHKNRVVFQLDYKDLINYAINTLRM